MKKALEDDYNDENFNVVGIDDGKNILKIILYWSRQGKVGPIGPKRCIILAAVTSVPETYHNLGILLNLISLHEIEYILSCDLKLANIVLGLQNHSSKYPCCYGECMK